MRIDVLRQILTEEFGASAEGDDQIVLPEGRETTLVVEGRREALSILKVRRLSLRADYLVVTTEDARYALVADDILLAKQDVEKEEEKKRTGFATTAR